MPDHDDFYIRDTTHKDIPTIISMIQHLATFEKVAPLETTAAKLAATLSFAADDDGPATRGYATAIFICTQTETGEESVAGYTLYFPTFCPRVARPGLYIEEIFVLPEYRRRGLAKMMYGEVAQRVFEINEAIPKDTSAPGVEVGGLDWACLEWNERALGFYEADVAAGGVGGQRRKFIFLRVEGVEELKALAERRTRRL